MWLIKAALRHGGPRGPARPHCSRNLELCWMTTACVSGYARIDGCCPSRTIKQASPLSSHLQIKPEPSRCLSVRQRHGPNRKRCRTPEAEGVWERSPPRWDKSRYRLLSRHSDQIYYDDILSSQMTAERLTGHMGPSTAPPPQLSGEPCWIFLLVVCKTGRK